MSLYFCVGGSDNGRLETIAKELQNTGKETVVKAGPIGWLWVDDQPLRFGPAKDESTGVTVVSSGRLVCSAFEWEAAKRLPYRGGLANRLILEKYLTSGPHSVCPYNGSAIIIIHDSREDIIHVWTDQLGYHPCFIYREDAPAQCIITTFPDLLLADPCVNISYDLASMAEFIRGWRATPPNTYFSEVKHTGAAVHITIDIKARQLVRDQYWRPFEEDFYPDMGAATEALSDAVRMAITERTAIARRPLVFISGGADSRVLIFSASDRTKVTGVNLYERAATETDIARKLCETAGCGFASFQRDNDYYPRNLPDIVHWSGAMWSAEDTHYPGFSAELASIDPDLVMTACTTDWVFKGYGLEKKHNSLFGRNLPIMSYANKRVNGFLPNYPLPSPLALSSQIDDRLATWFSDCAMDIRTPRERLMIEDRRIRPTAYTVSVSGSVMYRVFPYDIFLADSRVADCYSKTHPDWKLNHELWGKVAERICGDAKSIVNSNYGWKLGASTPEKLVYFAYGWLRRRLTRYSTSRGDETRPPSAGSWPDFGWYAKHSPTLKVLWESVTHEEREMMAVICGSDPWDKPLASWSADGNYLMRVLTLLIHWRECSERRKRASLSGIIPVDRSK